MTLVTVPVEELTPVQVEMWQVAGELFAAEPKWCVVGGQMVQLHGWRAGRPPERATDDLDAGIAARADRDVFSRLTAELAARGFSPVNHESEIEYRWTRPSLAMPGQYVQFDLMLPRRMGPRVRTSVNERRGFETRGVQWATDLAEPWCLDVEGHRMSIAVPSLLGAILAKAVALHVDSEPRGGRHLADLEFLCHLVTATDLATPLSERQKAEIHRALGQSPSQDAGVCLVRRLVDPSRKAFVVPGALGAE